MTTKVEANNFAFIDSQNLNLGTDWKLDYKRFRVYLQEKYLVTSDGDFAPLVEHLLKRGKLYRILSLKHRTCSWLLRKYAKNKIDYLENVKVKLKKHP